MNTLKAYEIKVKHPCGYVATCVNANYTSEEAIEVIKNAIGMENDADYVNSCEILSCILIKERD